MVDRPHQNIKFLLDEVNEVHRTTVVVGTITAIDTVNNDATVETAEYGTLTGVEFHYHCEGETTPSPYGHSAFAIGDNVLVLSKNAIVDETPERWIIGHQDGKPRRCGANFWIDLSIDGNPLVYGGQAIYMKYTDTEGVERVVGPQYVPCDKDRFSEGYTEGVVGNFFLQAIDYDEPVFLGLGRVRAISPGNSKLLDESHPDFPFSNFSDKDLDDNCNETVNRYEGDRSEISGTVRTNYRYAGLEFMFCYFEYGGDDDIIPFTITYDVTSGGTRTVGYYYGMNQEWLQPGCQCGEFTTSSLPSGNGVCTRNVDSALSLIDIIWDEISWSSFIDGLSYRTLVIPPGHPDEGETRSIPVVTYNWNLGLKVKEHYTSEWSAIYDPYGTLEGEDRDYIFGNAFYPDSIWDGANEAANYGNNLRLTQFWKTSVQSINGCSSANPNVHFWPDGSWTCPPPLQTGSLVWDPPDSGKWYILVNDDESPPIDFGEWLMGPNEGISYTAHVIPGGTDITGIEAKRIRNGRVRMVDTPTYWF